MDEIPSSVYRLQVGSDVPLAKAKELIPYLYELGIEGVYCSPIFDSFSSGYDVLDPNKLNPVLGTQDEFEQFCLQLKKYKMKHILDVIPNHMGIQGDRNHWWLDVLEKGLSSSYAPFFDIYWNCGKVLLPLLKQFYGKVLENKEIELFWQNGFWLRYFEYLFPISYSSYSLIISSSLPKSKEEFVLKQKSNSFQKELIPFHENPDLLHELLEKQYYRLAFWKAGSREAHYRRFFNIDNLIAIHIEDSKVLTAHHQWVFQLLESKKVQGLRVDHCDGLYDPEKYFARIRDKKPAFIWVEKILGFQEELPDTWDIDGTVGYDFLNLLSSLFVQKKNERKFTRIYEKFIEDIMDFEEIDYERRKRYLLTFMLGDLNELGSLLEKLAKADRNTKDFTKLDLTYACLQIMACFPVYRTYIKPGTKLRKEDREAVLQAVKKAVKRTPEIDSSVFFYIQSLLFSSDFVLRFQQFTASAMAKGFEDSTLYVYNRLISLNEVGGFPSRFGIDKEAFHRFNQKTAAKWPLSALASSTHDTKFSEDARLRLHTISERPKEWEKWVFSLKKKYEKFKPSIDGRPFPDLNTEYFLYQMILALWPAKFDRLWPCLRKAIRQAGAYSSWENPSEEHEEAAKKFLQNVLRSPNPFSSFLKKIEKQSHWKSLSALVLKLGSRGIFDLYQGNELMNFCLMDPDNRLPVDFDSRKKALKKMRDLKMLITAKGLRYRRKNKELFLKGDYVPIASSDSIVAFLRIWKDQTAIVIAKRFFQEKEKSLYLKLPREIHEVQDIFTDRKIFIRKSRLFLPEVFDPYPFAILHTEHPA